MSCASGVPFVNFGRNLPPLTPYMTCTPKNLDDVVSIVRQAEAANKRVHPVGSRWSFSDCATTADFLIETRQLNQPIQTVQKALTSAAPPLVYHVQAGMTIKELYDNLDGFVDPQTGSPRPLGLLTMGGSSGQSVAGAVSTGTHGGDKFLAPLADTVLAIHIVGAGGVEYWIEPSQGITDPSKLMQYVAPNVSPGNIIYDDSVFDSALVSLGCMGVIYSVVLQVRDQYRLMETTTQTTWQAFKSNAAQSLSDVTNRFLQVIVDPYADSNGENLSLVTTRNESFVPGTSGCSAGDLTHAILKMIGDLFLASPVEAISGGLQELGKILQGGGADPGKILVQVINYILEKAPDLRGVLAKDYAGIVAAGWPAAVCGGDSFRVMDTKYRGGATTNIGGDSIEMFFEAVDANGNFPFADFVDSLITTINSATDTFLAGYVALRFMGRTRACLGMQQWDKTCSVEISTLPGVKGGQALLASILDSMYQFGGVPHWGQELDFPYHTQGNGIIYPRFGEWRKTYAKMSNGFTARTFENSLSTRWGLTTPPPPP